MLVNQAYQALAELELLKRAGSDIIPSAIGMPGPAQRQPARGRAGLLGRQLPFRGLAGEQPEMDIDMAGATGDLLRKLFHENCL